MIHRFMDTYGYPDWPVKFRVGATHTVPFGLDDTFRASGRPLRIHAATDRGTYLRDWETRTFDVFAPFDIARAKLLPSPHSGFGNILRLFVAGADFEIRVMHMRRDDLDQFVMKLVREGKRIPANTFLGRAGNAGLSVGSSGGHHTHTEIVSIDRESKLLERLTREHAPNEMYVDWGRRKIRRWAVSRALPQDLYENYLEERKKRKVEIFNEYLCRRIDYLTGEYRTFYDSALVFNGM